MQIYSLPNDKVWSHPSACKPHPVKICRKVNLLTYTDSEQLESKLTVLRQKQNWIIQNKLLQHCRLLRDAAIAGSKDLMLLGQVKKTNDFAQSVYNKCYGLESARITDMSFGFDLFLHQVHQQQTEGTHPFPMDQHPQPG